MGKRIKITVQSTNEGKVVLIDKAQLAASNERIEAVMSSFVREFKRRQRRSQKDARELVLNA